MNDAKITTKHNPNHLGLGLVFDFTETPEYLSCAKIILLGWTVVIPLRGNPLVTGKITPLGTVAIGNMYNCKLISTDTVIETVGFELKGKIVSYFDRTKGHVVHEFHVIK